ncbi:MAG: hypothetical protein AABO57_15795 [Acidobacteriota bacterium]
MIKEPPLAPLTSYLKKKDVAYYGKVCELREVLENWLNYIPQTFPNYTRHTIQHSDEIVLQISRLLFRDDELLEPEVSLSGVEAYILVASAYLHDSGMVTSDQEKLEILNSDRWRSWISSEEWRREQWTLVQSIRYSRDIPDDTARNFLADLQTRFLVAEFIRREHHIRASKVIQQFPSLLGRFAFDHPMLQETIERVCVGHGLSTDELEDREEYPELRDIRGEKVNVRFMAILLRLGDLLDMSSDRACPLLLNPASPVPADSYAHWTQYQRISQFAVTPDQIEIRAKCQNQEEHRLLQDWCSWIVNEIEKAATLMAHAPRHSSWKPPRAKLGDDSESTIKIVSANDANYIFRRWTFELDQKAIFQRLIYDLYDLPEAFVRELIQNGLDANRSQMYLDLDKIGVERPEYPTQVEEGIRINYPVSVTLSLKDVVNPSSEKLEKVYSLSVEDCGIGMDLEVIERYFLQVGRSFYTTDEFRRKFRFVPTSRFGLGFLSVFAVSDHVIVETYKPTSRSNDGPLRLTLKGPKNYLLIEKGARTTNGTRIEVQLRMPMALNQLTSLASMWCRRVEFPIAIDALGKVTTLRAEGADDFVREVPDVTKEGASFAIRAFPINRTGIEGEIYVLTYTDEKGESWAEAQRASWGSSKHPLSEPIRVPNNSVCMHGIAVTGDAGGPAQMSARVDYRGRIGPTLSRKSLQQQHDTSQLAEIVSRREELLTEHLKTSNLAKSNEGWKYKNRLADAVYFLHKSDIDSPGSLWSSVNELIPVYVEGRRVLLSFEQFKALPTFRSYFHRNQLWELSVRNEVENMSLEASASASTGNVITSADFDFVARKFCAPLFHNRHIDGMLWLSEEVFALDWSRGLGRQLPIGIPDYPYNLVALQDTDAVGFAIFRTNVGGQHSSAWRLYLVLLNHLNPFTKWFEAMMHGAQRGIVTETQRNNLFKMLPFGGPIGRIDELKSFVAEWRKIPDMPSELIPPDIELKSSMFEIAAPNTKAR